MSGSLGLIWAQASNGVIGRDGAMPWHVPEDMAHFKELTLGDPVIMGRRTWDSLPPRFRPLPGRRNIVVTRQPDWSADGAEAAHSVDEALSAVDDAPAWVIGGAQIYAGVMAAATHLEVTEINAEYEGDTVAPVIDSAWQGVSADPADGWYTSRNGIEYRFLRYERP